eukprot:Lithocolla_globosa_v1_NODE_5_length_12010_cov_23.451945.p5 type:complete len:334 gc:universal NODE_5_length_12010_cov_23.451945:4388-3387(-)
MVPSQNPLLFTFWDKTAVAECRSPDSLKEFQTPRALTGNSFYYSIFSQPLSRAYIPHPAIITVGAKTQEENGIAPTNIVAGKAGSVLDADRCCEPTVENRNVECGTNFQINYGLVELIVNVSAAAYVNEVSVAFSGYCGDIPSEYYVHAWVDEAWQYLAVHETGPTSSNPCIVVTGDVGLVAMCTNFLEEPVISDLWKISFQNDLTEFQSGGSSGGWLLEVELHGVVVNQPVEFTLESADSPIFQRMPGSVFAAALTTYLTPFFLTFANIFGSSVSTIPVVNGVPVTLDIIYTGETGDISLSVSTFYLQFKTVVVVETSPTSSYRPLLLVTMT